MRAEKLTKFINLDRVEKDFYVWISGNRRRITLFIIVYLFIVAMGRLPYLNLYLTKELLGFIFLILGILVLNFSANILYGASLALFALALILVLIGRIETAEFLGDYIYVILFVGVVQGIINFKDKSAQ